MRRIKGCDDILVRSSEVKNNFIKKKKKYFCLETFLRYTTNSSTYNCRLFRKLARQVFRARSGGFGSTSGPENCRKCDSAATPIVAENNRRNRSTRNSSKKRASQFFTNNSYQIFLSITFIFLLTRHVTLPFIKNGEFRASLHKFHTRLKNSSGISARLRGGDANNRKRNSYVIVVVVTRGKHSRNGRQQKERKFIFVSFE